LKEDGFDVKVMHQGEFVSYRLHFSPRRNDMTALIVLSVVVCVAAAVWVVFSLVRERSLFRSS
jgi:hypothetical protein